MPCYSYNEQQSLNDRKKFFLIFDNLNEVSNYTLPKKYRNAIHLTSRPLYLSGSAQPTFRDLKYIIKEAKKFVSDHNHIFIIDLRQEPHVFLNNKAISWYGFRNQVTNKLEQQLIAQLSRLKTVKIYKGINKLDEGYFIPKNYIYIPVNTIQTEQQITTKLKVKYKRFLVTDHYAPEPKQVELFIEFLKKLPPKYWLHFHCRGGKGRTTTFMVLYDIIKNANVLSLEEILNRQQYLGGIKLSTYQFKMHNKKWKEPAAKERYKFIKNFYNYVLDPKGYNFTTWSKWLKKQSN